MEKIKRYLKKENFSTLDVRLSDDLILHLINIVFRIFTLFIAIITQKVVYAIAGNPSDPSNITFGWFLMFGGFLCYVPIFVCGIGAAVFSVISFITRMTLFAFINKIYTKKVKSYQQVKHIFIIIIDIIAFFSYYFGVFNKSIAILSIIMNCISLLALQLFWHKRKFKE